MGEGEVKSKEVDGEEAIRVLIVEDHPAVQSSLERTVSGIGGYEPIFTDNTMDALKILKESKDKGQSIDLVFSDLRLKDNGNGGLEIAKTAKEKQLAKHFILFTTSADKFKGMSKEQLEEKGINSVVDKFSTPLKDLENCFKNAKELIKSAKTSRQFI